MMTPFNIALLFCRLLSIWCVARFVEAFGRLATLFLLTFVPSNSMSGFLARNDGVSNVGISLGMFFLACALWLGAPVIARAVAQNIEYSNVVDQPKTTSNWWNVGRGLLGLYILITGLSGLFGSAFYLIGLQYFAKSLATSPASLLQTQLYYFAPVVSAILQIILGAWLLLISRRHLKREADSTSSQDTN